MSRKMLPASLSRTSRQFKRHMLVLGWLMVVTSITCQQDAKCPRVCFCHPYYLPEAGPALRVECRQGGMQSIPVLEMEKGTNQLIVAPPLNNPNFLSIGPILTQPVPFSKLLDLTISNSNVPSIGQFSFWGLLNLKTLNLTRNNITSISMENFRGLINLSILHLDYNYIEKMQSETFRHIPSLTRLSLSNNKISTLPPRIFRMLGKLSQLDLSSNPIYDLNPEVFKDIQSLNVFKCRKCNLKRFNAQICHLTPYLEELDLGDNLFKYLSADEFNNLKTLERLYLDGNQLSVVVDHVFGQNQKMHNLGLGRNRLALLTPGAFTNLSELNYLDISYNKLEKFHLQAFAPVVNTLASIDFSGNNLSLNEIATVLQILPNLDGIGLANLSLKSIPQNFFMHNNRLKTLDISSNQLTQFPISLLRKTKFIQSLDISNNEIISLNEQDLHRLEAIPQINLASNAWHCDQCSVGPMLKYMKTTVLNETLRDLRCHAPMRLQGVRFVDLTNDSLDLCSALYEAQINVIAGMVLVLVAVLGSVAVTALCCTRRRGERYNTHEEKRWQRDEDFPEELLERMEQGGVSTIHAPLRSVRSS